MTKPLTEQEIDRLASVPIFAGVPRDQLGWIVRRVEWEHGIGEVEDAVRSALIRGAGADNPAPDAI